MVFFVVWPYGPLCHPFGSKEGGKNEKTTLCKTWFFGLVIRASMRQGISHTKPPQGQKKKSFELQSAPNLHRDKKNFKKTLQFTWEGASIPLKFLFFCPCAGFVHFEVQNFCFFVPVQVCCTLKFKTQCIVTCVL